MANIHRRPEINPERGIHEYGDVEFADPVNNKYPIDTAKHVRAAWSYIHHKNDAAEYSKDDQEKIKNAIRKAAKKFGVELTDED